MVEFMVKTIVVIFLSLALFGAGGALYCLVDNMRMTRHPTWESRVIDGTLIILTLTLCVPLIVVTTYIILN